MPGEQHPALAVQVRAGEDGVAVAAHLEMGQRAESGLHGVGEHPLVAGDTGHVDERGGERDGVGGEVEGGGGGGTGRRYRASDRRLP